MSIKEQIDLQKLPSHVAVIMDGNGRWAKQHGMIRTFGHQHGVTAVRETAEAAAGLGIKYLTLYAFSTENWNRPRYEINALMDLLIKTISKETKTLNKNNIRLQAIGDLKTLPQKCYNQLLETIENTSKNSGMTLVLALSYSGRWEITEAVKSIAQKLANGIIKFEDIDEKLVNNHLGTCHYLEPELLIRTSGEHRISNFLLWQIAYAELYFTDKLWPDFRQEDFFEAILNFQQRERRFGGLQPHNPSEPTTHV